MRKMNYGTIKCDLTVAENFRFETEVICEYEKDTVIYAVERFLAHSKSFRREFTRESWQLRLAKGKKKRSVFFTRMFPAALMELPGEWVRVTGKVDREGIQIQKVELLKDLPA